MRALGTLTLAWTLLLAGFAGPAAAWTLGGSLKSLDLYSQPAPLAARGYGAVSSNRLRLDLKGTPAQRLDAEIALDTRLLLTDPAGYLPLPSGGVNRVVGLDHDWQGGRSLAVRSALDRLNLGGELQGIEWCAGRQAIGFGRIALFSPLDIIAPFPPDALDTEVRPGVDALRLVHYFGLGGQVGATAVFGDVPRHNSYLGTFSTNLAQIDVLAITGILRQRPVLGLGLAGSLGPLGLKGEVAGYHGTRAGTPGGDLHRHFAIAALETWYRFDAGPILLAEYLYNGAGSRQPGDYPAAWSSAAFTEGLIFLAGRHYLLLGPSWEIHPLVKLEGLVIANLVDGSVLLRPMADFSLSDNAALQLFWSFSRGAGPRRPQTYPLQRPQSEFGSVGDSGGLFFRYFF